MLENIGDYLSFFTMVGAAAAGLYLLFSITDSHHDAQMKKKQERYYAFYENSDDNLDDSANDPYDE